MKEEFSTMISSVEESKRDDARASIEGDANGKTIIAIADEMHGFFSDGDINRLSKIMNQIGLLPRTSDYMELAEHAAGSLLIHCEDLDGSDRVETARIGLKILTFIQIAGFDIGYDTGILIDGMGDIKELEGEVRRLRPSEANPFKRPASRNRKITKRAAR